MTKMKLLKHLQYGRERHYPGCDLSKAICAAMRLKCISEDTITCLTKIGNVKIEYELVKEKPKD